jgi:hypothetical protein
MIKKTQEKVVYKMTTLNFLHHDRKMPGTQSRLFILFILNLFGHYVNGELDTFGNNIVTDYRNLGLKLKHQGNTLSCISQSIATLVEAYFALHPTTNRPIHQSVYGDDDDEQAPLISWSGFDIYYCHLNELNRRFYRTALRALKGKRIASDRCPHSQVMAVELKGQCQDRGECSFQESANIEEFGELKDLTTQSVMAALKANGPLGILHHVDKELMAYLHHIPRHGSPNPANNIIFYQKDYAQFASRVTVPLVNKFVRWHAMVLVGYGFQADARLFWIFQNSHGKRMGYNGYIYAGEHELNFMNYSAWYIKKASKDLPLSEKSLK